MRVHEFRSEVWSPVAAEELFPFFADARNLEILTPPWLQFRVMTPNIALGEGTLIDYRLRIHGVPLRWRTRINLWQPPHQFIDEQIRGPYRQWIHEHSFDSDEKGTLVRDHVRYAVFFDFIVHRWLVRPEVERIFAFRAAALKKIFALKPGA
jgi:ligand-binding SRPBCC domain-containing protein